MVYTGITKSEIESIIQKKGDFMQIEYLSDLSRKALPVHVKKFIYLKLANIYHRKSMFKEEARIFDLLALNSVAFSERVKYYVKETEVFIRTCRFNEADTTMKKALREANSIEKEEIYYSIKDFYKKVADDYVKQLKRNSATKVYEKLLNMRLTDFEKEKIKERLIELYEKLGRFNEARRLEGLN